MFITPLKESVVFSDDELELLDEPDSIPKLWRAILTLEFEKISV